MEAGRENWAPIQIQVYLLCVSAMIIFVYRNTTKMAAHWRIQGGGGKGLESAPLLFWHVPSPPPFWDSGSTPVATTLRFLWKRQLVTPVNTYLKNPLKHYGCSGGVEMYYRNDIGPMSRSNYVNLCIETLCEIHYMYMRIEYYYFCQSVTQFVNSFTLIKNNYKAHNLRPPKKSPISGHKSASKLLVILTSEIRDSCIHGC